MTGVKKISGTAKPRGVDKSYISSNLSQFWGKKEAPLKDSGNRKMGGILL
jgi:hypothetical protein